VKDHEVSMASSQLDNAIANAKKLKSKLGKKEKDIPAWIQAKITDTDHNMDAAAAYSVKEDLRKWFGTGGEGGVGGGGWDKYNTKGERIGKCAREPGEPKPKCLSKEKASQMGKNEIATAVKRKRKEDPVADRSGKGGKPIMSSNKIDEQSEQEYQKFDRRVNTAMSAKTPDLKIKLLKLAGQSHPVKTAEEFMEACWKGYKQVGLKKKGTRTVPNCVPEETELDEMIALAAPIVRGISAISRIAQGVAKAGQAVKSGIGVVKTGVQAAGQTVKSGVDTVKTGVQDVIKNVPGETNKQPFNTKKPGEPEWKKGLKKSGETAKSAVKTTVSGFTSMYEPREEYIMEKNVPTNPSLWSKAKSQARAKFDVYPSAYANGWAAKWYKSKGGGWKTSTKESYDTQQLLSFSDFRQISNDSIGNEEEKLNEVAAWQRKEGKNQKGGLNEKGRKSYERENPGSDLKAPQPEGGSRRNSFCARMKGLKKKLTSKKTANDPNSRVNKSLRAWNC